MVVKLIFEKPSEELISKLKSIHNNNDCLVKYDEKKKELIVKAYSDSNAVEITARVNASRSAPLQDEYIRDVVLKILLEPEKLEDKEKKLVKKAMVRLLNILPKETMRQCHSLAYVQEEVILFVAKHHKELYNKVSFAGNYDNNPWDYAGVIEIKDGCLEIKDYSQKAEVKTDEKVLYEFRHSWADGSPTAWWQGDEVALITEEVINSMVENLHDFTEYFRIVLSAFVVLQAEV